MPSLASLMVDAEPGGDDRSRQRIAVLPYSSGTTGLPKGVMLVHRSIVAQLNQIDAIESVEMPALLGVLPFFHIYGMVIIMMHGLMRGATIVTMPKFEFEPFLKVLSTGRLPARTSCRRSWWHSARIRWSTTTNSRTSSTFSGAAPLGPS